jgi:AAA15 family ATPase/GTPase
MIIKHAHITKFRAFEDVEFDLGTNLTAIVGHNGTSKTTLLGILGQPFSISKNHPMNKEKTIDGFNFKSQFQEKFKFSPKDIADKYLWRLDLTPGIHRNLFIELQSTTPRENKPRFWSTEGKGRGMGYVQIPVYYLSLKRSTPIGEETDISTSVSLLEDHETQFLLNEYTNILSLGNQQNLSTDYIKSRNKENISVYENGYGAFSISAGQDVLSKILIAILSFKRLKDKYKTQYKGGILLIDEIESSLHPAAQEKLISRLYRYSQDYKIQFIFTTHSPTIIKSMFSDKYKRNANLIYLKRIEDTVKIFEERENSEIDPIVAELNGKVFMKPKSKEMKIRLFCEDDVAYSFVKVLVKSFNKNLDVQKCSLGAENYIELLRVKLPDVCKSIIVLDGDKNNIKNQKKLNAQKPRIQNVLFLPSEVFPEKMFYDFLQGLKEDDDFWDNTPGGFDKQKCFSNYTIIKDNNGYKKWYKETKNQFGRASVKLFNYWIEKNPDEYDNFINIFKKAFNYVAHKNGFDDIMVK